MESPVCRKVKPYTMEGSSVVCSLALSLPKGCRLSSEIGVPLFTEVRTISPGSSVLLATPTLATAGGLDVVMDRCIKIEHARFRGRMHWFGLNTGRISARREKPV